MAVGQRQEDISCGKGCGIIARRGTIDMDEADIRAQGAGGLFERLLDMV